MDINKAMTITKEAGFDTVAEMDPKKLQFRQEVRDMCAACKAYGKRWTCPPACGEIDEMPERYHRYSNGIIFQTIVNYEDEFDYEGMGQAMRRQGKSIGRLIDLLSGIDEEIMLFGSDGCGNCEECTYPDNPCRFPDRAFPSMEATGLLVSDVCKDNDVKYYYGRNIVAFTGAFLFNTE